MKKTVIVCDLCKSETERASKLYASTVSIRSAVSLGVDACTDCVKEIENGTIITKKSGKKRKT